MGVSIPYVSFVLIVMEVAYLYICSGVRCAHAAADLLHVLTCLESHWTVLEAEQVHSASAAPALLPSPLFS